MKKNILQLGVVVVLLGVAVAAFLLLRDTAGVEEESSAAEEIYLLGGIPQPFVRSVSIQNQQDSFTIENGFENTIQQQNNPEAASFGIDGLATDTLNQSTLKAVMNAAGGLSAKKMVIENPPDLSIYGLSSPRATVTVAYESSSAAIAIGDDTPGSEGTYVLQDGNVYLVATSKLTNLLGSRLDFVEKTVTGGDPQTTVLTRITLTGAQLGEQPVVIEKAAEDSEAAKITGFSSYVITSPIVSGADSQNGVTPLISVFGLTAESVVALAPTIPEALAPYGLAEPYLTVSAQAEDPETGSFVLHISPPDPDGSVHLLREGGDYIYQMSAQSLPFLELTLFDLREKMVLLPHIDTVSKIEVFTGETTHTFVLEGEGDELTATADGQPLEPKYFRAFYQTLLSARFEEEIPPESLPGAASTEQSSVAAEDATPEGPAPQAAGDLLLQYTYYYRDGSAPSVVSFTAGPPRKALVRLDEGEPCYTRSVYIDRVLEDLPKLLAGQEVQSYY